MKKCTTITKFQNFQGKKLGGNVAVGVLMASKGHDLDALLEQKTDIEQKLASLERQIYH
jgi:hypothetical protein